MQRAADRPQRQNGDTQLDGLNVVLAVHTPERMADGNWLVAAYIDERADDTQTEALGAIFTGAAGGPIGALAAADRQEPRRAKGPDHVPHRGQ